MFKLLLLLLILTPTLSFLSPSLLPPPFSPPPKSRHLVRSPVLYSAPPTTPDPTDRRDALGNIFKTASAASLLIPEVSLAGVEDEETTGEGREREGGTREKGQVNKF